MRVKNRKKKKGKREEEKQQRGDHTKEYEKEKGRGGE